MQNSTRRRVGHRAASPANMHENTRSRAATASGGTPSLAREEADDEAAALVRQAGGDTTGAAPTASPTAGPAGESAAVDSTADKPAAASPAVHTGEMGVGVGAGGAGVGTGVGRGALTTSV